MIKKDHTHLKSRTDISNDACVADHLHKGQIVPLTTLVVVMVVGRGDFYRPCTKTHIHKTISDNRESPLAERMCAVLAYQVLWGVTQIMSVDL